MPLRTASTTPFLLQPAGFVYDYMDNDDIVKQVNVLINDLGMSESEARACLGIPESQDSTHISSNGTETSAEDASNPTIERILKDMFPNVPLAIIKRKIEIYDDDIDRVSEDLLSHDVLSEEAKEVSNIKARKQAKVNRKKQRQFDNEMENKLTEVQELARALKVSVDEAAMIYSSNDFSLSNAIKSKSKPILPNYEVEVYRKVIPPPPREDDSTSCFTSSEDVDYYSKLPLQVLESMKDNIKSRLAALNSRKKELLQGQNNLNIVGVADNSKESFDLNRQLKTINVAVDQYHLSRPIDTVLEAPIMYPTIDLHGYSIEEAKLAVDQRLRLDVDNKVNGKVTIITGRGNHSTGGKPVLRPWFKKYVASLAKYNIADHEGYFVISKKNGA